MSIQDLAVEIKKSTDFQKNLQLLREKITADLVVSHNDGLFTITPELISFLSSWTEDEIYLEDAYHNPILCNRVVLLSRAKEQYQKTLNRWHNLHEELKRVRKI